MHSAFILNCKKRKVDSSKPIASALGETSTVLKFAGTVNQVFSPLSILQYRFGFDEVLLWNFQDTDITYANIAKLSKEDAKEIVNRKKPETGLKKRLEENREKSQQNRFKIVNYTRALKESTEDESTSLATNLTILDVVKDDTVSPKANDGAASSSAQASSFSDISDEPYVYDLYIAETGSVAQYPDSIDINDLRLVLLDEVYCSFYALM